MAPPQQSVLALEAEYQVSHLFLWLYVDCGHLLIVSVLYVDALL